MDKNACFVRVRSLSFLGLIFFYYYEFTFGCWFGVCVLPGFKWYDASEFVVCQVAGWCGMEETVHKVARADVRH